MTEPPRTSGAEHADGGHRPPRRQGTDWVRAGEPQYDREPLGAGSPPPRRPGTPDLSPLFVLLDAVVRAVPRELREQFVALVREVLLTLRALIDWYLDRLDAKRREPHVEDIPIE
jgi:hypothetical protein